MKISLNWLKDYIVLDEKPETVAHDLAMLGLPVETLERVAEDWVVDVDVTANRPDCLNHVGMARELSARYGEPLRKPLAGAGSLGQTGDAPVPITIEDPDLCARYCGLAILGVRVAPSPVWLQGRLTAIGQRPINNVVDVTNYVLMELGHPLHAFDLRKLKGGEVRVRRARPGETIVTLDGVRRELAQDMLLIADAADPVGVAGVMGGESSEVDDNTVDIFLESAWFEPASIRKTARAMGLSTEASYRFERGADPAVLPEALIRAARLIMYLAGGKPASAMTDVCPRPFEPQRITLRRQRLHLLGGVPVEDSFVQRLLGDLGFGVEAEATGWTLTAPSHRPDITQETDVIEEVVRFYGYDRIPSVLPPVEGNPVERKNIREREAVRLRLKSAGYQEITTSSFVPPEKDARFDVFRVGEAVALDNPGDDAEGSLRTNLTYRMLATLKLNLNNFNKTVNLFEIASVYARTGEGCQENLRLSLGAFGTGRTPHWTAPEGAPYSFFHLKGAVESLLELLGVTAARFEAPGDGEIPFLQPGNGALLRVQGAVAGFLGRLDDRTAAEWKFHQNVFIAEVDLGRLFAAAQTDFVFRPVPRFPPVGRDMSFTVDRTVPFSKIKTVAESLNIAELSRFEVVEIYRGKEIPPERQAMMVRLVFQKPDGTLTDAEADGLRERISEKLRKTVGAVMR